MVKLNGQPLKLGPKVIEFMIPLLKGLIFCMRRLLPIKVIKSQRQCVKHLVGSCKQSSVIFAQLGLQLGQGIAAHPALHVRPFEDLCRHHLLIGSHLVAYLQ